MNPPALRRAILPLALIFSVVSLAVAQDRITMPGKIMTVSEAIGEIETQTGLIFGFNNSTFDIGRKVSFSPRRGALNEILEQMVKGTAHTYMLTEGHILIIPPGEDPEVEVYEEVLSDIEEKHHFTVEAIVAEPMFTDYPPKSSFTELPLRFSADEGESRAMNAPSILSVKTNLLYGVAALAPNLSVELGLGHRTSLDLMVGGCPWKSGLYGDRRDLRHFQVRAELRWWEKQRLEGHFIAAHIFYWDYNMSGYGIQPLTRSGYRYGGFAAGVGVSYGYLWKWNRNWGMEFNLGAGVGHMEFDKYSVGGNARKLKNDEKRIYIGPTNIGVRLVYVLK